MILDQLNERDAVNPRGKGFEANQPDHGLGLDVHFERQDGRGTVRTHSRKIRIACEPVKCW